MRTSVSSESGREAPLNDLKSRSWLQYERRKLLRRQKRHSLVIEVPQPPILPCFKPVNYSKVLAEIQLTLNSCSDNEKSNLYFHQYQVFEGLGDIKLMRSSLILAWRNASTDNEKVVFGAWLKYATRGEEPISDLLSSCVKRSKEREDIDIVSKIRFKVSASSIVSVMVDQKDNISGTVCFQIKDEKIKCDRQKIASLSLPFYTMLYGCSLDSVSEVVDLSKNNISSTVVKAMSEFSIKGKLRYLPTNDLGEIMIFSSFYFCEKLTNYCERMLIERVSSRDDAVEVLDYALVGNCPLLAAFCLQKLLQELPESVNDERVVRLLTICDSFHRETMAGSASFALYCLLSKVAMDLDTRSNKTTLFLKQLVDSANTTQQKMVAHHMLGCVNLLKEDYDEAKQNFETASTIGHDYSVIGLARISRIKGDKRDAYNKLCSVILKCTPLGWMFAERSGCCEDNTKRLEDLEKAKQLDPTLPYSYMCLSASLMKEQNVKDSLVEINKILAFKPAVECLELRFYFHLLSEDYESALSDVQAILIISPDHLLFDGRKLTTLYKHGHVSDLKAVDYWEEFNKRWSAVDQIRSLSVIFKMLKSGMAKGSIYYAQTLVFYRLKCPQAAIKSLLLALKHASSEHERLVYEGWILHDAGYVTEGLQKANASIKLKETFEAFFLAAYCQIKPTQAPTIEMVPLLRKALKCRSPEFRKIQARILNGRAYVESGDLMLAARRYNHVLGGERMAHLWLARVHYSENDKQRAYKELTNLISKEPNNAFAYEQRSLYASPEQRREDLDMVTRLDPLRPFPYRFRAAVLMDNKKHEQAINELSRVIAFKPDVSLLILRSSFYKRINDPRRAEQDHLAVQCFKSLSFEQI